MRTVLGYPGNMADAQNSARALLEAGALEAYVTTFAYRRDGWLASALARLPADCGKGLARQLARRSVDQLPAHLVHGHPRWELARMVAVKAGASLVTIDRIWDRLSHSFDRFLARRYVPRTEAVAAYEYTALETFTRAKRRGVARILLLPSLDSRKFEDIQRHEKSAWPELVGRHDAYFDARFERRYARRCAEIALADVVITNSRRTARSHIEAGADADKVFSVPLAAPPFIAESDIRQRRHDEPLKVLWAGPFSLRKGAHYLLQAWQGLGPQTQAHLNVYGAIAVPDRALATVTGSVKVHGSVPQSELFKAYASADILVFPTLSDGFGMVVAEAMAHGLPVITTDQAGAADLVTPDNGIIVPAGNARALADALGWCLDNRARLAEMRLNALDTARRRQWSDFRRDLIKAVDSGLRRSGYNPKFGPMP
jgi:glycosyltransferase involved in cell wall biosynthesis